MVERADFQSVLRHLGLFEEQDGHMYHYHAGVGLGGDMEGIQPVDGPASWLDQHPC